jgi:two-component system alkaline phosphatase synthesis response regulator PhoP
MSAAARILIIDDDPSFAESNRDLLEAYGYEVATAPDGQRALATAIAFRPDLVILDVMMTHSTEGFEVARELRRRPDLEDVGILLVTGMARELNLPGPPIPDVEWLPVDRVLEKPIDPARLIAEVERVLQKQKKGEQT